jgi:iron complex transport system substrate-binding protein
MIAESRTGAIPDEERVRVYAVVGTPLTTYGGDQYFSSMVKTAGGINVAESLNGSKVVVSKEQLMEWDPEVIIVLAWGAEMSSIQDILDDPALQEISAVKNTRIYSDPGYYSRWVHPDITSCLGTLTMAKLMYPERFTDVNVTAEADAFDWNYFGKPYMGSIPQS